MKEVPDGESDPAGISLASRWWLLLSSLRAEHVDPAQLATLGQNCHDDAVKLAERDMAVRETRFK